LVDLEQFEHKVLAKTLDSTDIGIHKIIVSFDLARVRKHQVDFICTVKVVSCARRRTRNLVLDEQRLDIFACCASYALVFEVPKQIVKRSLLDVLLVHCTHIG
jgi:hypothetical protein